jgi:hypothetical protein
MIRVLKNIRKWKFNHFKIATKLDLVLISIDIPIPPKSILIHMAINFEMSRIFLIEKKKLNYGDDDWNSIVTSQWWMFILIVFFGIRI